MVSEGGDRATVLRSTRQRRAITHVLESATEFQSAQSIHDAVRRVGEKVGLATVYRTLQAMADAGEVDAIQRSGGETVYRQCSNAHHHHLVCRTCGRTVEVAGPAVERWARTVARDHDFTDVNHTIELFGVCSACRAN